MEIMTKTAEQKLNGLEQKLALAKELGLKEQVSMIHKEIKIAIIEQKCTYEEVTKAQAKEAMCPKSVFTFERKMTGKWYAKDWAECEYGNDFFSFLWNRRQCDRTDTHTHDTQKNLKCEPLGTEENKTAMPMAALIRMKEAKEKTLFESFEIWRPETNSEEEARLLDPWLVGVIGNRYFKLCDWR